ncbi:hypothetical protein COU86_00800 [Candidatus Roizmanbacteria bacterium CG10_big_fil_rev_8_21_14_0_10_36_26]|uniref:EamA domain-containing protein n=1 Tax=Candidatus Roizmanbacteria bacterium CG10_big_fil_rev_8_21_14_0_10_36_26 TaxID=1974851 RepID=A0A2M8KML6_9BACT|nr:MAG: hypothetical protein CO166_03290 [Candidatus Roizmanbacteria bacterium CG_4_9_14_3_um_filter_36_11]PJE61155.1 MAG: hypothetical protein COU86_00800 [Candidatus Roizmanbacteria bacterium CG10_big_fil_rev_8_21_14_0_10_36_26]
MNWFIYSLFGAIFMTAYGLAIRLFLKDKGDSKTFTFITTLFGGLALLLLLPFETIKYLFTPQIVIVLILLSVLYALTDLSFIRGRQLEEVSIVSILVQLGNFWALIGGTLIFKELLTFNKMLGVGLIVLGSILLVWHKQKISLSKGKFFVIIGTILFTINSFADKVFSPYFSASLYKAIIFLLEAFMLFTFFLPQRLTAIKKEFKIQGKAIIFVGPLLSLAVFFLFRAFQVGGEASKVLPVYSLSLVFSVIAGILFLNEKDNLLKKIIAMVLVLAGTYILQLV